MSWPDAHLTPTLVDELRERLERYSLGAAELLGNSEAARVFAGAVTAYQRQALSEMLGERLNHLRQALTTVETFELPEGPMPASPLTVALITLPAEVQLLRDALSAHP